MVKREASREYAEGVCVPEELDRIVQMTWGWRLGPFVAMDQIGLDVVRDIENVYFEESGDPKDKPPAFLDEMIARGELGVKSGKGFYTYPNSARALEDRVDAELSRRAQSQGASSMNAEAFIGIWRLVSCEATAGGQTTFPLGREPRGSLLYTAEGRMSVTLSKADRLPFASGDLMGGTPDEKVAAFDSCLSYCGAFEVRDGQVIHRLERELESNLPTLRIDDAGMNDR